MTAATAPIPPSLIAEPPLPRAPSTATLQQLLQADPEACTALANAMQLALIDIAGKKKTDDKGKKGKAELPLFPPQAQLVQEVCFSAADTKAPTLERVESFLAFNDKLVRWIPTLYSDTQELVMTNVYNHILAQHFVYACDEKQVLLGTPAFREWMRSSAQDWGNFCDTVGSVTPAAIESMEKSQKAYDPDFRMNMYQYDAPPSGYMTWNQLFAREVGPARRPVDYADLPDSTVVSPADCVFKATYRINDKGEICGEDLKPCKCSVKGRSYGTIEELLGSDRAVDKETAKEFYNGRFFHSFLGPADYHRFRAPVRGFVKASKPLVGQVYLQVQLVTKTPQEIDAGKYNPAYRYFSAPDNTDAELNNPSTWEFRQERGLLLLDTAAGLLAVLPIGMAQVSGVNMTAKKGSVLAKGEEFGYFTFGGSDIITVYTKAAQFKPAQRYIPRQKRAAEFRPSKAECDAELAAMEADGVDLKRTTPSKTLANTFIGVLEGAKPAEFKPYQSPGYDPLFPVPLQGVPPKDAKLPPVTYQRKQ